MQTVDKDCRQKCNVGTHEHPLAYGEQRENVRLTLSLMSVVKVPMYEGYVRERGVCVFTCTRVHARMHMQACICT